MVQDTVTITSIIELDSAVGIVEDWQYWLMHSNVAIVTSSLLASLAFCKATFRPSRVSSLLALSDDISQRIISEGEERLIDTLGISVNLNASISLQSSPSKLFKVREGILLIERRKREKNDLSDVEEVSDRGVIKLVASKTNYKRVKRNSYLSILLLQNENSLVCQLLIHHWLGLTLRRVAGLQDHA